jgi:hypothetical protein
VSCLDLVLNLKISKENVKSRKNLTGFNVGEALRKASPLRVLLYFTIPLEKSCGRV